MLGNSPFQQNDDRAVLVLRQDIHSFCPRRYVEGLMMSCRLARPKSGLIERQLLGDFGVATDGGIWVAAGASAAERFGTSQIGLGTPLAYQRDLGATLGATFLMAFFSH